MRNPIWFTISILLFSHVAAYWDEWGVTCEPEDEIIKVCGGQDVSVTKCRGTCRSVSRITMNFPFYKTTCECCKVAGWRKEVKTCNDGSKQEVFHAKGCSCQKCLGA